ncbi:hypothetical protein AAEX28_01650 [Lentisphaerota bacterium WC36G]|nr:hypothetical protein LJT99_04535 [Lentisphaerae bacterium WC36]
MILHNDLLGALILISSFVILIIIAELLTKLAKISPEISRKFVHFFCGISCLAFPFLVMKVLTVFFIATLFALFLFISGKMGKLKSIHGVKRDSFGGELYPFSVFAIFYICQDHLWLYFISILILTTADAGAAIIGSNYGKIFYKIDEVNQKSLEGSTIFFLLTLQVIQLPLLLMTDIPKATVVLSSLLVALLLTGVEAISSRGTDNILVPVIACYVLLKITTKPFSEVAFQCISLSLLATIMFTINHFVKFYRLRDTIIMLLFFYAVWSLCSIYWALPLFAAYAVYLLSKSVIPNKNNYKIIHGAVSKSLITPLLIVFIANFYSNYNFFYEPFVVAIALTAINSHMNYFCNQLDLKKFSNKLLIIGLTLLCIVAVFGVTCWTVSSFNITAIAIEIGVVIIFAIIFKVYLGKPNGLPLNMRQAHMVWILSFIASAIISMLEFANIFNVWR